MIRLAKSLGRQTTAAGAGEGPRAEGENCPELGLRCQEQPDGQAQRVLVGSRPNAGSTPHPPTPAQEACGRATCLARGLAG